MAWENDGVKKGSRADLLMWVQAVVQQSDAQKKAGDSWCTLGTGMVEGMRESILAADKKQKELTLTKQEIIKLVGDAYDEIEATQKALMADESWVDLPKDDPNRQPARDAFVQAHHHQLGALDLAATVMRRVSELLEQAPAQEPFKNLFADGTEWAEQAKAAIALLEAFNGLDHTTRFWKNCRAQRKRGAKICQVCPFRPFIESLPDAAPRDEKDAPLPRLSDMDDLDDIERRTP